jgi:acetoacetyl-CoA synthetase
MTDSKTLWNPSEATIANANLTQYREWLAARGLVFDDYQSLWSWSTEHADDFWGTLIDYFDIQFTGSAAQVTTGSKMPHVKWFEGMSLNYAEHVFRMSTNTSPAIIHASETFPATDVSWSELSTDVAALADFLQAAGIEPGDRIAAYLPCIPEATVGFLSANSIGAVWACCSPDFGLQSVLDRFIQIQPKILIVSINYSYNGKQFDKTDVVRQLADAIPSLRKVIVIGSHSELTGDKFVGWDVALKNRVSQLKFVRMPFSHPIWIVFSSGTTGLPKAITHSVGGILLEHLKYLTFHNDLHKGERLFWYTTTGWMMWNYLQSTLLCGGTMVLYDGSPAYPDMNRLWQFCDDTQITHFGTSAGFILACRKERLMPSAKMSFKNLRSIGSTGSTLPPEGFDWVFENIKKEIWLASMSGGTDVASAFVGGNPTWPVHRGEIQCRALGCRLESWDENGKPVVDTVGEMVITKPMPSMPVYFWNDPDFVRYHDSYFDMYPGVWRHGDWIEVTSSEGVIIYGRSDATLNRGGVRIGTSEIYRAVDKVAEVRDSLIVCIEKPGGDFYMPLFVVLKDGQTLTDELKKKVNGTIRSDYSPRHVPDEIVSVPDIPYTISGKKTETPVKKILMGRDPKEVINPGSLRNPQSLDFFAAFQKKMRP